MGLQGGLPLVTQVLTSISEPAVCGHGGRPGGRRLLELAIRCYQINGPNKTND